MTAEYSTRAASFEDAAAISDLIHSLAGYFLADPENPDTAASFFATVSLEAIRKNLDSASFRYRVAQVEGSIVGVIGMLNGTHIYHLFVGRAFHRRGIATRLWIEARRASEADGNAGRFTVNASLHAVPMYEGFGFHGVGEVIQKDGVVYRFMELEEEPQEE